MQTEIISADSRQCFKELNIGVAKPSIEELRQVHHYFINTHSIHQEISAADFEQYALQASEKIFQKNKFAVMVGGTGLYIKAFCEGLDRIPEIDPSIREEIIALYKSKGLSWLQREVAAKDPAFWKIAEQQNPHRLMRALEVFLQTGESILHFRTNNKVERPFNILKIAVSPPKEILHQRINHRVDVMVEQGLVEEVKAFIPFKNINALQTVGYKELFTYFEGNASMEEAVRQIKTNTRRYAKRQVTWFKRDTDFVWVEPSPKAILALTKRIK